MFDPSTADLIRRAPPLEGLDSASLPDRLTDFYARIVTARLRLRSGEDVDDEALAELVLETRRLAFTNEALVSVSPDRDDRAAAAFVAATAHQLVFNAERIRAPEAPRSYLDARSISPDIAAMLLFLVAEASADAREMALRVESETEEPIERALVAALRELAQGHLIAVVRADLPPDAAVRQPSAPDTAASALYLAILKGVRTLALRMLQPDDPLSGGDPVEIFRNVRSLCTSADHFDVEGLFHGPLSVFSGPGHLASILIAVAGDMARGAVVALPPPGGVDPNAWRAYVGRVARRRPVLWRNHRDAIDRGYLEPGVSSAVGFPTGSGKSTVAELKIGTVLLSQRSVVFLAPTHALVDQTRGSLARSFPTARVRHEYLDETDLPFLQDEPPDILVMTPEACLARMSFDASILEDAGLLVFDECHLLHPTEVASDRRALDSMLCVINFARVAPDADFLLLSAMMKNTEEIAEWLEDLTQRHCLSLSFSWKPTRQLRGSVVYQDRDISALNAMLQDRRLATRTKTVPASVTRAVPAQPFGLFSLKQTWETRDRNDYAFSPLLDETPLLGVNSSWQLTPNSGEVSSAIAAAAAKSGIKTLIFFQTIRNAASAAKKISDRLGSASIRLSEEERRLFDIARRELGHAAHLYLSVRKGRVETLAAVHHGLLLPEERRLVESLYERADGIGVLTATSTVAQGMNLPSELVIIAEDSRFDQEAERRKILKAQELLNAAGRAGRAGHNANGIVLVVPGRVITFNYEDASIGSYWTELHQIFGQSDQCLDIDDPLTAVLDRVHANLADTSALERYCIAKLAGGGTIDESREHLSWAVERSLGGFRARRDDKHAWLVSRIDAAMILLRNDATETDDESIYRSIAATVGLSVEVIGRLAQRLDSSAPSVGASVTEWCRWFFSWLLEHPDILDQILRRDELDSLFGKPFNRMEGQKERAHYAVFRLNKLAHYWMSGRPLRDLEVALGIEPKKLKTCNGARRFVLRIVPSLAYAFSLPVLLKQHLASPDEGDAEFVPPQLAQLAYCMRHGFDTHEKAALSHHLRSERLCRVMLHERFNAIQPYLAAASAEETWEGTLRRVKTATNAS